MSFTSQNGAEETSAWGGAVDENKPTVDVIQEALKKEAQIKDIVSLQDSLRGILAKITETEKSNESLQKENEMLDVYITNLSKTSSIGSGQPRGSGTFGRR